MKTVELVIDDKQISVQRGERILWAALDAGIYIPHLCAHRDLGFHPGACRLCFVEVLGRNQPVSACAETVQPGMVVYTRSERVDRLVRSAFELLISTHRVDCKDCPANKRCALQEIARERKLPLRTKRLKKIEPNHPMDDSHPRFGLNPNHCVLCGRCVYVCNELMNRGILDFTKRGLETVVSTFDHEPLVNHQCEGCLKCVEVCPVGALYFKK